MLYDQSEIDYRFSTRIVCGRMQSPTSEVPPTWYTKCAARGRYSSSRSRPLYRETVLLQLLLTRSLRLLAVQLASNQACTGRLSVCRWASADRSKTPSNPTKVFCALVTMDYRLMKTCERRMANHAAVQGLPPRRWARAQCCDREASRRRPTARIQKPRRSCLFGVHSLNSL